MKLVLTVRTRDLDDVIDAQLAYHLNAGVDFVIATDHRSVDGTREILRRYEREGHLRLILKEDERLVPGEWTTEMARLAATEHGADWVVNADGDEFWWPRGGDLKDAVSGIPSRFGAVFGLWRHFAPRPEDGAHFSERMTVRLAATWRWNRFEDPFHRQVKVAHRADPSVRLLSGSHDLESARPVLRGWYPIEVLHFPLRSREQAARKYGTWAGALRPAETALHVGSALAALREDRFDAHYERYVVDDAALAAGLASGELAVDTRLRDALRGLAGAPDEPLPAEPRFLPVGTAPRPEFRPFGPAEELSLALDAAELPERGERLEQRVAALERRLAAAEAHRPSSLVRRLRGGRASA